MSARKKNSLSAQVRRAYRQDGLARVLTMPEKKFGAAYGMETVEVKGDGKVSRDTWRGAPADYYHFKDNGAKVLAVAHLDTVVNHDRRAPHFHGAQTGPMVVSGALDDRLGAYVILDLLPKLGVSCDTLLTVGEEDGQSTASLFTAGKDYDHVIEFDRSGTDVVMYQYECRESRAAVEACGARMGTGSFSDIAYLEHLGVKAFNWGVGYQGDYHSERGYAYLSDTFAMTAKYLRFNDQNAGVAMPHEPDDKRSGYDYGNWDDDDLTSCLLCEAKWSVNLDTGVCGICDTCNFCAEDSDACLCYTSHALSDRPVEAVGWREHDAQAKKYNDMFGQLTEGA
jgi:hypothetical protein